MLTITRRDIEEAKNYARDAMRTGRDYQGGQKSSADIPVVQSLTIGAGAAGVGYLTGRYGALHIGGNPIPLDLATAIGLHAIAFFGKSMGFLGDGVAGHTRNLADGALAGYLTKFGVGLGTAQRAKAGAAPLNLASISGEGNHNGKTSMGGHNGHANPGLANGRLREETKRNKGPLSLDELAAMAQAVR